MAKKDVIKDFTSIKGVGEAKAELLYDNGFDSIDKLKSAKADDLTKIKGISEKNAKDILKQLKEQKTTKDTKSTPKKETESKEPVKKEEEKIEIVEEEKEDIYRAKKKPKLSKEISEKLKIRKQIKKRTPEFSREEWFRYKRLSKSWRRPDGITSKMRINLKYRPSKVRVGFRGPKEVRGLHSSGFEEILVHNISELENINPDTQAIRIGGKVGTKKRIEIAQKAEELDIRILNLRL